MKKTFTSLLLAGSMLAVLLTGCGSSSAQTSQTTTANAPASQATAAQTTSGETASEEIDTSWPDSTVYVYVGAKAGGGSDINTRTYTQFFEKYTGKTFTVVNDATGNGSVVYENEIDADPDGLTLMMGSTASYVSYLNGQVSAPLNDRSKLTLLGVMTCPIKGESDNILIARKDAPYNTLEEYVAYAKENPEKINFGIQYGGGSQYIAVMCDDILGIRVKYVDAGSVADKLTSIVGGNIDACIVYPSQAKQYLETGDVKALAVLGENRSSVTPDVPSLKELGYDRVVDLGQYQCLFGPANMDPATANAIRKMVMAAEADPDVKGAIEAYGFGCESFTIEEGYAALDKQYESYLKIQDIINGK